MNQHKPRAILTDGQPAHSLQKGPELYALSPHGPARACHHAGAEASTGDHE
jgi:hypothetical protein